jgi:hypothetical protein
MPRGATKQARRSGPKTGTSRSGAKKKPAARTQARKPAARTQARKSGTSNSRVATPAYTKGQLNMEMNKFFGALIPIVTAAWNQHWNQFLAHQQAQMTGVTQAIAAPPMQAQPLRLQQTG